MIAEPKAQDVKISIYYKNNEKLKYFRRNYVYFMSKHLIFGVIFV